MKNIIKMAENLFIQVSPSILCCAINYDRFIEEEFFLILDFVKKNFRTPYYAVDASVFLLAHFSRKEENMYINFSEPRRLNEIATSVLEERRFAAEKLCHRRDCEIV